MIGENDEDSEELYDSAMKPIIEDRLKNGKYIRVSLDELMSYQVNDENLKKEAWAKLNQMLKEADEAPDSDLTMDDVLELTLLRIKEAKAVKNNDK